MPLSVRHRRAAAVLAAALMAVVALLAGCTPAPAGPGSTASAPPAPSSAPAASPSSTPAPLPAGGVTLAALGFHHAPAGFAIPEGVAVRLAADMDEVVVAEFSSDDGAAVLGFLDAHLPAMGYTVTASAADALVFSGGSWEGAFVLGQTNAMLELRRQAS